jgi:cytochrome c oxidase assembly factor 6
MGWFPFFSSGSGSGSSSSSSSSSSSPSSTNSQKTSSDGGRVAPDRSSREQCYHARDVFFECLDRGDILDAIKHDGEARRKCAREVVEFETACSKAWAKYFKERRVMEYNRDKTIERIKNEDDARTAELKKAQKQRG